MVLQSITENSTIKDLEAIYNVPVKVVVVVGTAKLTVAELLKIASGDVISLTRRIGEPVEVYVNNRFIARGEVVMTEGNVGVMVTEIIKSEISTSMDEG